MTKERIFTWVLRRFISPQDREEQGYPPVAGQAPFSPSVDGRPMTVSLTEPASLIPATDKLLVYRSLTGIDTVPALRTGHSARTAPNIGLYTRVVRSERSAARGYRVFNVLINACLGIQIIVAAILTSLGAANGPRAAVTGFGAINTIIAGILTYLKGSGLPNRLKYHENEWKAVREYIEQREREFCLADCSLDVHDELQVIEDMYQTVKMELEANRNPGSTTGGAPRERKRSEMPRSPAAYDGDTKRRASSTMVFHDKSEHSVGNKNF
ncbi:hypothetical protein jhhlp_006187 [Lomentospora prolificans]|uniref:SMODS and SLOG-associating 2TM effector domain-containing protein n=1 Tax=Lomentospora prolificans TaxID=41688 RepID=A0A2N3N5D3_9PEZI|nr:hypothetical protein jhhlp_006187 [Lomentospora prolificans]